MACMYCQTAQPCAKSCNNCEKVLGRHYCDICRLWDDDARKSIYHCDRCGLCRIGQGLGVDYYHCDKCNVCMAINLQGRHRCIERNLECDCPICGEYMFTSTSTVIFMPCGHCIHFRCHQAHVQRNYQCPTCLKSLGDMTEYFRRIDMLIKEQPMPAEYDKYVNQVLCNDCEKRSYAKYHFLYHKCKECKGYNTKVIKTLPRDEVDECFQEEEALGDERMAGAWPSDGAAEPDEAVQEEDDSEWEYVPSDAS